MAEKTEIKEKIELEREYIIPLRKEWQKVANYRRAGRAVKAIKKFLAKHMKVPERDVSKVKLDIYLNQEIFFHGRKKPPAKIKVKAIKYDSGIVKVFLSEMPKEWQFAKQKHEKRHKKTEPKEETKEKAETEKKEEKTEEQKQDEKEKEKAIADLREKEAKQQAKEQKHATKTKQPQIRRMALQK